jgi:hypothetical protein
MASLRDLAAKVLDGTVVLSPRGLARESDDDIVARLSAVRGIGPWTAEMFLIFQLRRLDVWPVGDLGVRRGYGLAWQVPEPTARELKPLGEPFRPYRSVAAWYCWRAAELYAGAADSGGRLTGWAPGRGADGGSEFSGGDRDSGRGTAAGPRRDHRHRWPRDCPLIVIAMVSGASLAGTRIERAHANRSRPGPAVDGPAPWDVHAATDG